MLSAPTALAGGTVSLCSVSRWYLTSPKHGSDTVRKTFGGFDSWLCHFGRVIVTDPVTKTKNHWASMVRLMLGAHGYPARLKGCVLGHSVHADCSLNVEKKKKVPFAFDSLMETRSGELTQAYGPWSGGPITLRPPEWELAGSPRTGDWGLSIPIG
ncbi:hypothetical protein BZA05DRAFT_19959 [Tricharina praecox]|uniref:uncharacterized protein n=1 Tax=Tricharina praecox TaxID=43433 RepID=UPI00221EF8B9|nr:uncharacterized protein BZA05DRAFT_19959 [Tricharina praecox]KAI5859021.1 hypothetical protein BZA05DRAFT_19959 [Tricharina praecox]